MPQHLAREIDKLKARLLNLSAVVEDSVHSAVQSVMERSTSIAEQVIASDNRIDAEEIAVEEECLKILALHQPLSADLRYIVAVLKINNDLERIGDQAVNIARRSLTLTQLPQVDEPFDVLGMARHVKSMLREALDALVNLDAALAKKVCQMDGEVDEIHRQAYQKSYSVIKAQPEQAETMILYLSVSRNLERIADLAENIAEDVLYMISGEIVRHSSKQSHRPGRG